MAKFASRCGNTLRFRLRFKKWLAIAVAMPWCTYIERGETEYGHFCGKYTGRGLVVKRPGVLSKVQMLTLVLGVGVCSILPIIALIINNANNLLAPFESLSI